MSQEICSNCGANSFIIKDGHKICKYCNSKFELQYNNSIDSTISLQSDIDILLQKCKDEPHNAKKYVNLILDIDPTNKDVQNYL